MTERAEGWVAIAHYAAGYDAAGIPSVRRGNDTVGLFGPGFEGPTARGVDVLVPATVAVEAREVLADVSDVDTE